MKKGLDLHEGAMEKFQDELGIEDIGTLVERHGDYWAILEDKGYVGMERNIRCISKKKKTANRNLNFGEIEGNSHHVIDSILIENYFGRLVGNMWEEVPLGRVQL